AAPLAGVGSTRTATCGISTLATGVHSIVATYNGDAGNATSSSPPLSQTITGAAGSTSTVVTSSANPSQLGASVTFTASVTGTSPTGTVRFLQGNLMIPGCTAVALTGSGNTRTALCSTAALPLGNTLIRAFYFGDAGNSASNGQVVQTVQASTGSATTTVVTTSGTPSIAGTTVTFTASVTGNAPTGTVSFTDAGSAIAGCPAVPLSGTGNTRTAQCATSALAVGSHTVAASYGGDGGNLASSGSVTQVVQAGGGTPTTTTLATSGTPSTAGASVTFTASVTGVAPTGNVAFTDNGSPITACAFVALTGTGNTRTAQCALGTLTVGTHTISGNYAGDLANLASSGSVTQVVNAGGGGTNVALASAGAVATASSTMAATYPTSALNNNERAGVGFGAGGVWTDGTMNALPDWVQISFGTTRTIDRVVVYSVQDNYLAPVEPTDTLTFTTRGLTAFAVQGWNGSAWVDLATVSGNNLVKRTTTFAAYTTSAIRINVTGTRGGKTYMTEVEAWGN
ncbi:MAG: Ig-like domain repeat protein, partial [Burkholderiales bacterium]|nr:Ig-like domain repeat protein [Burkholderiales bacterium]